MQQVGAQQHDQPGGFLSRVKRRLGRVEQIVLSFNTITVSQKMNGFQIAMNRRDEQDAQKKHFGDGTITDRSEKLRSIQNRAKRVEDGKVVAQEYINQLCWRETPFGW